MRDTINRWLLVVLWIAVAALVKPDNVSAQAGNVEAAKKEGKVVVYGSVPPQSMEGLHQAFKKKYGIDIEYWRGSSTQVSERALTEWRAGRPAFDIAEGNRGVQLIMKGEGLFQKFIPPSSEKFPPPDLPPRPIRRPRPSPRRNATPRLAKATSQKTSGRKTGNTRGS